MSSTGRWTYEDQCEQLAEARAELARTRAANKYFDELLASGQHRHDLRRPQAHGQRHPNIERRLQALGIHRTAMSPLSRIGVVDHLPRPNLDDSTAARDSHPRAFKHLTARTRALTLVGGELEPNVAPTALRWISRQIRERLNWTPAMEPGLTMAERLRRKGAVLDVANALVRSTLDVVDLDEIKFVSIDSSAIESFSRKSRRLYASDVPLPDSAYAELDQSTAAVIARAQGRSAQEIRRLSRDPNATGGIPTNESLGHEPHHGFTSREVESSILRMAHAPDRDAQYSGKTPNNTETGTNKKDPHGHTKIYCGKQVNTVSSVRNPTRGPTAEERRARSATLQPELPTRAWNPCYQHSSTDLGGRGHRSWASTSRPSYAKHRPGHSPRNHTRPHRVRRGILLSRRLGRPTPRTRHRASPHTQVRPTQLHRVRRSARTRQRGLLPLRGLHPNRRTTTPHAPGRGNSRPMPRSRSTKQSWTHITNCVADNSTTSRTSSAETTMVASQ